MFDHTKGLRAGLALFVGSVLCAGPMYAEDAVERNEDDGQWSFVKEEEGVKVYTRDEPNSNVVFIKGEGLIDGGAETVFDVLSDTERTPEWITNLAAKKVLQEFSADERTIYTEVDMPWPLTDRYFVSRSNTTRKDGVIYISSVSTNEPDIQDEDKVKGHVYASNFRLYPRAGGKQTYVVIEMKSDPKGMIPKWVVNSFQIDMPVDFFKNLNAQVKRVEGERGVAGVTGKTEAKISH